MSRLDLVTWAAIGVLTAGSFAVFVWFLRDVRRLYRDYLRPSDSSRAGDGDATAPPPQR